LRYVLKVYIECIEEINLKIYLTLP